MIIARIIGNIVSTQKNRHFEGYKLLLVQPVDLDTQTPKGTSLIALDKVNAGDNDLVLVNKEGSGARLMLEDENIPVQAVIVGVIDGMDVNESLLK